MKRKGNIYPDICSMENLELADARARRHKGRQREIREFDKDRIAKLEALRDMLVNKRYKTSEYQLFKIHEPKERDISKLPYYPDRIVHHAIMNELEQYFVACFTADSYSCIKGRGVHKALGALKKQLKDAEHTQYCLKLDIRKFYPNVDHDILKQLLRRKFKDNDLFWLLDEIIDSAPGLPIGNYLSQYFANFYLTGFDHWLKEEKRVKVYFRYKDDMVILHGDKAYLHQLLHEIREYLRCKLKLELKENYQVFPVDARGIDMLGYVVFHKHVRVRKRIKKNCARRIRRNKSRMTIASYKGWFKHGNCRHLTKKLFGEKIW
jgi:retron-type reverse transcriptase